MDEAVKRADLYLRTKYPHLITRIFKQKNGFYLIYISDYDGDFSKLEKEFDYSIKPIATPVKITNKIPIDFIHEIYPIKDTEIGADLHGLPLNIRDFRNLLTIKFPQINIIHLESPNTERKFVIYTDKINNEKIKNEFIDYIKKSIMFFEIVIIENLEEGMNKEKDETNARNKMLSSLRQDNPLAFSHLDGFDDPIMNVFPTRQNRKAIPYEERDEQLWFDKLNDMFLGTFTKSNIIGDIDKCNSCYIDYAIFQNVNIRNGIVLYDKIFIEPPVDSDRLSFCNDQKIKTDELIHLVKENKLVFVLPQPYFRYDFDFLIELYGINPNCILSRRALSALIICDLVEINKKYFINTLDIGNCIYEISQIVQKINGDFEKIDFYNTFMWPQRALRSVLEVLLFGSTYRTATFGINNLFMNIFSEERKKEIEFEFVVNADKAHISSALNSQYFPHFAEGKYSNRAVTSLMGNMLNLFKNSTTDGIQNYINNRQAYMAKNIFSPINLIEVDEYISVSELSTISQRYFSAANFNSIISYLLSFSPEEMNKKIKEYNQLVEKDINKKKNRATVIDFSTTAALDTIGLFIPFIGTGLKVLDVAIDKTGIKNNGKIESIREAFIKIGKKYDENKAVSFLSKINSVARLKKMYD
jgi:hypothetical protein